MHPNPQGTAFLMLAACQSALAMFEDTFPYDHGRADVGQAWADLDEAVQAGRAELMPGRRYVAQPGVSAYRLEWHVRDTQSPNRRIVGTCRNSREAWAMEDKFNARGD